MLFRSFSLPQIGGRKFNHQLAFGADITRGRLRVLGEALCKLLPDQRGFAAEVTYFQVGTHWPLIWLSSATSLFYCVVYQYRSTRMELLLNQQVVVRGIEFEHDVPESSGCNR